MTPEERVMETDKRLSVHEAICAQRYQAIDTRLLGNYLFIAPNTLPADWKNATVDEQLYGCFGRSSDNTVQKLDGSRRLGYVFW